MQRSVQSPKLDPRRQALSEAHGGTGAMTLAQAAKNLNLVTTDMLNAAGGVAGLDANLLLSTAIFPDGSGTRRGSINGPLTLVQSSSTDFKITDFDMNKTYTLAVTSGSVSRVGDTVTVVAPAATGSLTLTLNGQQYVFAVVAPHPVRPTITSPVAGSLQRNQNVYVSGSAYNSIGTALVQKATHWQVSSDPQFGTLTNESANDTVNLLDWVFQMAAVNTTYYIRVRYQNSNDAWSDWSVPISIRSANEFLGAREEAKLMTTEAVANAALGYSSAMTAAGDYAFVGNQSQTVSNTSLCGAVYIFKRTGTTWALVQRLISPNVAVGARFGILMSVTPDGSRIAIQEYQSDGSGKVYIYTLSSGAWAYEATISPPAATASWNFGVGISIDGTGTRLALGERGYTANSITSQGRFHIYLRTGTSWALEQTVTCPSAAISAYLWFGHGTCLSQDGTRVVIGSLGQTVSNVKQMSRTYVYLRTGTTWALEQELVATDGVPGDTLGVNCALDSTATYAAIGAKDKDGGGVTYIFKRSGTVWTQTAKIKPVDGFTGDNFGTTNVLSADGTKLMVTAPNQNVTNILNCGAAYAFTRSGEVWTQALKYSASDIASGDLFGNSMAGSSDLSRFVVGSAGADVSGVTNAGASYVFS